MEVWDYNDGITSGSIHANGAISGCPSIWANFHQGNVYNGDFREAWSNRFKKCRNRIGQENGIELVVNFSTIAKGTE